MRAVLIRAWAAALLLCAAVAQPGRAQEPGPVATPAPAVPVAPAPASASAPVTPARGAVALTEADAAAWLDGLMPSALRSARVPGAVVVLVKDGKPLLQKGYGLADWDKSIPVDPAATLFRPGSISKLFTWTAVMQLVEQGRLDLDADVNRYLDFQVPARNGKALTLRHVMTHTSGLEETARDLITFGTPTPDNGRVLKRYIPPYLYDPGAMQGYSNWATALAGYIVERVARQPFDDYVEQHVFAPLGMKHSSFRQPLPAAMQGNMSQGYTSVEEPPKGFEIVSLAPAGSLSSTGADMARFMLAYLGQGELDGARILKPETVRMMHTTITRGLPGLNGIGLGFYQQDINGHRAVGHAGDTILFHSDLMLLPDDGIGLFVSVNSPGRDDQGKWLRERLFHAFADRYLPDARAPLPALDDATASAHAQLVAGAYRTSRREDSTFFSVLQLLSPLRVHAVDHGRVAIDLGGERSVFREVQPFLWQEEHGKRRMQAIVQDGKVVRLGIEPYVFAFVFEPVPFMAGTTVTVLLALAFGVALLTALLWPVAAVLRRRHGVAAPARALTWVRSASCLAIGAVVLWTATIAVMGNDGDVSQLLPLAQSVSLVAFVGGLLAALWHARTALRTGGRAGKGMALAWVASFAVLVAVGLAHHLLSFNQYY
ncbi:serine hydrolase domain-containing protein [uncultured Massilia sp.]|uniref:serine hydrolase domain-containing protein n=1 Tax=uncultured Massilia sp. TaxID=169973 RepID=UPI0025DECB28|nr:serine hydrolase domain-containing protein [uncultured Massilia sp.]